jgi:6-phosphogluconolactonase
MLNNSIVLHSYYNEFCHEINNKFSKNNEINILISGGESVKKIFEHILFNYNLESNLNFILSDERVLPYGDKDRNDTYYFQKLSLSRTTGIYFFPLLNNMNEIIEFNHISSPTIHFTILGVGEDGHIASLFPNIKYSNISDNIVYTSQSPKFPACRVTYNSRFLKKSINRILIVNNDLKKSFVQKNLNNKNSPFSLFEPTKYLFFDE